MKKAQWSAHRVAEKNELISAKQIKIDKIKASENINSDSKNLRKEIYQKHLKVMESKPMTMEKYLSEMMKQGVKFIPTINKHGELQGFRLRNIENQTEMKASEVHRSMGLKNLLDSRLFFQDNNYDLSNSLQESHQISVQKINQEVLIGEKRSNNFPANNIFAPSPYIVDHTEDELKRKRKKTFRR